MLRSQRCVTNSRRTKQFVLHLTILIFATTTLLQGGALDDGRSAQDVQGELDQLKAELEMNMHTNAGVVDQYRKRQIEVCSDLYACIAQLTSFADRQPYPED